MSAADYGLQNFNKCKQDNARTKITITEKVGGTYTRVL